MTTHPNAERIRKAYLAAGSGDLRPMLSLLSDDIEWVDSTLGPLSGTYRGKDQVPDFFSRMMQVYGTSLRLEVIGVVANDQHAVVLTREAGVTHGEAVSWSGVHVWFFDEDRCNRFVAYASAEYQRFWAGKAVSAGV